MAQRPTVTQMSRKFKSHAFTSLVHRYVSEESIIFLISIEDNQSHLDPLIQEIGLSLLTYFSCVSIPVEGF